MKRLLPLLAAALLPAPHLAFAASPSSPEEDLASFKPAPGFEVNLFASEIDGVVKPIQMRFDPRGRLWVIGSSVYPQIRPGETPNDKILILEDQDRDGRADKVTTFAEGLMIPTGIEVAGDSNACYLGEGETLWRLADTDGDGRADQREVVLRGFGTGDNHQNINSFRWGPAGELWFCQGLHNVSRVETPWGVKRLSQAGIWRLRPRSLRLQGFYGSAAEPQNPWGFVFTRWGEPIELAGNNSSIIYPVPGLVEGGPADQPSFIWKTGRGRKMSGGEIVENPHFPEEWQGRLVVGGYINNAIWAMEIQDDGSGFALADAEPLLVSSSSSFRPVDVRFGPDGALYLCDWHNPIIGHYQASFRHPDRDRTRGRIWRVTAKGRPLVSPPALADLPTGALTAHLASQDRWTRDVSRRILSSRPAADVAASLQAWISHPSRTDADLSQALNLLLDHERVDWGWVQKLAAAADPNARARAAYAIGLASPPPAESSATLITLAGDPHPRVRLHAVVAAASIANSSSLAAIFAAAAHPADPFIAYAMRQAVAILKPLWLPGLKDGSLPGLNEPSSLETLIQFGGGAETLEALRAKLRGTSLSGMEAAPFFRALIQHGNADDLLATLEKLAAADPALANSLAPEAGAQARRRMLPRPSGAEERLARLSREAVDPVAAEAVGLAGLWRIDSLRPALISGATTRPSVMAGLLQLDPAAAARLFSLRAADPAPWPNSGVVAMRFLERAGGLDLLAKAFESTPPAPGHAATLRSAFNAAGPTHPALEAALALGGSQAPAAWKWSEEFARDLAAEVRAQGNPSRGGQIYHRPELACAACHSLGGSGGLIGPSLDTLGTAQPVEFIIGALLDPAKEVKEGYSAVELESKAGDLHSGYPIAEEDGAAILRVPATGELIRVRNETIAAKRPVGTLMPSGLADSLNRADLRDLIAFLASTGRTP